MSKVKFFFPDSHDFVDPTFDFEKETRNEHRVIQRDDKYAHELFSKPVYDGILVSKAVVDGLNGVKGRYSVAQRQRFFREGIYRFFRLPKSYQTMGDCGAFSYAKENSLKVMPLCPFMASFVRRHRDEYANMLAPGFMFRRI